MEDPERFRPLASHPPTTADLDARRRLRDSAKRTPRSPPQDARFARGAPLGGREPVRAGRITRQPSGASKPLVPVTERRSQEESVHMWRIKRDGEREKGDIIPDGGSAGREGRNFTVANVGNNGRIYLRYGPRFSLCTSLVPASFTRAHAAFCWRVERELTGATDPPYGPRISGHHSRISCSP